MAKISQTAVARGLARIVSLVLLTWTVGQAGATAPPVNVCQVNLRLIDGAVQQWALEGKLSHTNSYSLSDPNLIRYFKESRVPMCPSGGVYLPARTIADPPVCTLHGPLGNPVNVELLAIRMKANHLNLLTYSLAVLLAWVVSPFSVMIPPKRHQLLLLMPVLVLLLVNIIAAQTSPSDEGGYLIRRTELPLLLLGSACGFVLCKSSRPAVRIYGLAFALPLGFLGLGELADVFISK